MARMSVTWKDREVHEKLVRHLSDGLTKTALVVENDIRDSFGDSGQTPAGFRGSGKKWRESNRSQPWEPPHVQTGHLKRSIGHDKPAELMRRVGSGVGNKESVGYGVYLEFGTSRMLPRPWLRPAIWRNRDTFRHIISEPLR